MLKSIDGPIASLAPMLIMQLRTMKDKDVQDLADGLKKIVDFIAED